MRRNLNKYTMDDLKEMQMRPPGRQINVAISKILEAIRDTEGDISISFSGGKDSCLVADLYCDVVRGTRYADKPVHLDFADTTNETSAMLRHVDYFPEYLRNRYGVNVELTRFRPKNGRTWAKVILEEGCPFISKRTASSIRKIRSGMNRTGTSYEDAIKLFTDKDELWKVMELEDRGFSHTEVLYLTGWIHSRQRFSKFYRIPRMWLPMLNSPVPVSEVCCSRIKEGSLPNRATMTGEMAQESERRRDDYLYTGCNFRLADGTYKSKPLGPMTEQAVLYGLKTRNVPICEDYGDIVPDGCGGLMCSKCNRTGCALCGFGSHLDPGRFLRIAETEPAKIAFAFRPYDQGGAGYKEICEYMNEYCGTNIQIPE